MAEATRKTMTQKETNWIPGRYETTEKEVATYTLILSEDEAKALRVLTGHATGTAGASRRDHTDRIWRALKNAGVPCDDEARFEGIFKFKN